MTGFRHARPGAAPAAAVAWLGVALAGLVSMAAAPSAAVEGAASAATRPSAAGPSPGASVPGDELAAVKAARVAQANQRFRRDLKRLQVDLLHQGARSKLARSHVNRNRLSQAPSGARSRQPRDVHETGGRQGAQHGAMKPSRGPRVRASAGLGNRPVNDPRADPNPSAAQSEVSVAGLGRYLVAGWNDGGGRTGLLGHGWSADSGATWVDGGDLPLSDRVRRWVSDPVVTVNERTGEFWLAAMAITNLTENAIAVLRGTFDNGALEWGPPVVTRAMRDTLPDKPWIAADSTTGNLYLTYTAFFRRGGRQVDQIEFQRAPGGGAWLPPIEVSPDYDEGLVQGSRPAVGPAGDVYVVWMAVDTSDATGGADYLRVRASDDGGAHFGAVETVALAFANIGSGGPGFDRGWGFMFPSIAVDRTHGPFRGRVYVAWNESVNYFDDAPGDSGVRVEREPNDGNGVATPFNLGDVIRGEIGPHGDTDVFEFEARQGESVIFYLDSLSADFDASLRVTCAFRDARIAYSAPVWPGRPRVVLFTPSLSGRYFVRLASFSGSQGAYRLRSGAVQRGSERGRDQRDVFVAWRDRGGRWSEPVRIGDDPPYLDGWLPEVAVAPNGAVYAAWYDWRSEANDLCGGSSHVYLARSDDGGRTWSTLGPVTDEPTRWSEISSNLSPNQGDYIGLHAGVYGVAVAWADGRLGDPDVYFAREPLGGAAVPPPFRPVAAELEWLSPNPAAGGFRADFALRGDGPAVLEVLDVAGRVLRREPVTAMGPGRHSARIDATDFAPGVYIVRLIEAGRVGARKLVLSP